MGKVTTAMAIAIVCLELLFGGKAPRTFGPPSLHCTLDDPSIDESSGIAPSLLHPGEFWTHNDDGARIEAWRFDSTGHCVKFTLPSGSNRDIEEVATARLNGITRIFLADIGDNLKQHLSVRIYAFEEPESGNPANYTTYTLNYPDGKHNAEAFWVDGRGSFWIVTKDATTAGVYRCASPKVGTNMMKRLGDVKINSGIGAGRLVTGGAISADQKHVVLRTYLGAWEYRMPSNGRWWQGSPVFVDLLPETQGEAICYSLDGSKILTTSEGSPCRVGQVPIK